jgi:hypothetical protein
MVRSKAYKGGYMPICKVCRAKYWRDRREADPLVRQRHTDSVLRSKMLSKHGLKNPDYERLVKEQGDRCALCGTTDKGRSDRFRTWNIDHCHKTNKVRGLLCHWCNIAVGYHEQLIEKFGEDRLMRYLHPERGFTAAELTDVIAEFTERYNA